MDLTISARASLSAALLDPVTGLGGSAPVGFSFGGQSALSGAGVVSVIWPAETGEGVVIDLATSLDISSGSLNPLGIELIQGYRTDGAYPKRADWIEIALVADPLAVDGYGNPIAASRASQITIQGLDADEAVHCEAVLNVTTAGQAAIFRRFSKLTGTKHITSFAVSGVTANACKVYILFGGESSLL